MLFKTFAYLLMHSYFFFLAFLNRQEAPYGAVVAFTNLFYKQVTPDGVKQSDSFILFPTTSTADLYLRFYKLAVTDGVKQSECFPPIYKITHFDDNGDFAA